MNPKHVLNTYLQTVERELDHLSLEQKEEELLELRQHIKDLIKHFMFKGNTEEQATQKAIQRFGAPGELGDMFRKVRRNRALWRIGVGYCFAVFFLFFLLWSSMDKPTDLITNLPAQIVFAFLLPLPVFSIIIQKTLSRYTHAR